MLFLKHVVRQSNEKAIPFIQLFSTYSRNIEYVIDCILQKNSIDTGTKKWSKFNITTIRILHIIDKVNLKIFLFVIELYKSILDIILFHNLIFNHHPETARLIFYTHLKISTRPSSNTPIQLITSSNSILFGFVSKQQMSAHIDHWVFPTFIQKKSWHD